MNKIFEEFTKQYQVPRTIRFGLTPVGRTEEFIEKRQYREAAVRKDEAYQIVKKVLDSKFKDVIEKVLGNCELPGWPDLEEALLQYQQKPDEKNQKILLNQQERMRKSISEKFQKSSDYKELLGNDLFKKILPAYAEQKKMADSVRNAIKEFYNFKTYFSNYMEVRKDSFSVEAKANTIAYRIVDENFVIFTANKKIYSSILKFIPDSVMAAEEAGKEKMEWENYDIHDIPGWFDTLNYQRCMTQSGIQRYNFVIGLLNSSVNQYIQQHPSVEKINRRRLMLRALHKQILSDRERPKWLPEEFSDGREGEQQIYKAIEELEEDLSLKGFEVRYTALLGIMDVGNSQIYIKEDELGRVSGVLGLKWDKLSQIRKEALTGTATNKQIEKELKNDISFAELSECMNIYVEKNERENLPSLWKLIEYGEELLPTLSEKRREFKLRREKSGKMLNQNEELAEALKTYLDAWQDILHFLNIFQAGGEMDKDSDFYAELDALLEDISQITPLYNKIRNYVTRKPYSTHKIRVMFENSSFLGGWGQKFDTKAALIFKRGKKYYIGVVEKKYPEEKVRELYEGIDESNCAVHFIYKFQKPDNKNLPRTFIRSKGKRYAPAVEKYGLPVEDIINIYDSGKFKAEYKKVDEKEYYESLKKMIDYFKEGLQKHEAYKDFAFQWKKSSEYRDISEFYHDAANSCFSLEKEKINFDSLMEQTNQGLIYLFEITGKDFNERSHGTPNLQTIYWRELFSDRNRAEGIIKLCGEAAIYMREASILHPVFHKKGSTLINKWYETDGKWKPIPDKTYVKFQKILQEQITESELTGWERELWNSEKICKKEASHTIIKDKRFTERKYMIHVPLMINYKQVPNTYHFNEKVRLCLKNNPDVNIIGIDRGERNLIYATVIDQKGEILYQRSYNLVEEKRWDETLQEEKTRKVDYHAKLEDVEVKRADARKSWKKIGAIKELKEGYLSQVIHELTLMMEEYNAIIVMEDLNMGFKGGRMKVEKNVYQKFEKMLIDKLNYLGFKRDRNGRNYDMYQAGGVMNGYQLADKFTSFKDMKIQNGFIFYVPAAYTSAIDPVTGFVDVFQKGEWKTVSGRLDFLKKMDAVFWDDERKSFVFSFDYNNFKCSATSYQTKWQVIADIHRIKATKEGEKIECNPNERLIEVLDKNGISYRSGNNLVNDLEAMDSNIIYEILECFRLILQMRNSKKTDDEVIDYIASPVMQEGKMFNSETVRIHMLEEKKKDAKVSLERAKVPLDADANGAYHIALKGLMCLQRINEFADKEGKMDYKYLRIKHEDWFRYAQTRKENECMKK